MRRILVALLLLFFGCIIAEIAASHIVRVQANEVESVYRSMTDYLEYIAVREEYDRVGIVYGDYPYVKDFTGQHMTVRNNKRGTTDQPTQSEHTIWLLGNSTTFDIYVSDSNTIASHLQRLVAPLYRVENLGLIAASTSQQLLWLQEQLIQAGDIVINYGGIIEVSSIYVNLQRQQEASLRAVPCALLQQYLAASSVVKMACQWLVIIPPDSIRRDDLIAAAERYKRVIGEMRTYTESKGARFINVLQPYLHSRTLSEREALLVAPETNFHLIVKDLWPMLQASDPAVADLTHALDGLRGTGAEFYFDYVHLNSAGNAIIARALADAIDE